MKTEIPSKNFYAVLTSEVLFNKELSCRQKILIAMISNMSNEKGYCWASNNYFAECLDVAPRTLQYDLEYLEQKKIINRVVKFDPNNNEYQRILTIVDEPPVKKSTPKVKKPVKKQEESITFTDPKNQSALQKLEKDLSWSKLIAIYAPKNDKYIDSKRNIDKQKRIWNGFTNEEQKKIIFLFTKFKSQLEIDNPWISNFFTDKTNLEEVEKYFLSIKDRKSKTIINKSINWTKEVSDFDNL